MDTLNVIVDALSRQGRGNMALRLVAENGEPLPAWQAGAHIDVHLPQGIVRQYSLAGNPARRDHYLLCVKKEAASRGGSRYLHETLRLGQRLTISAPRNVFPLAPAGHYLLLAAGIGITPLLAMAEALDAAGTPFELHYYVKQRGDVAFAERLAQGFRHGRCTVWSGCADHSPRKELPPGLYAQPDDARLYLCGPADFMAHVARQASDHGWQPEQIHTEAFCAPPPVAPSADEGFSVTLRSTGESYRVPAEKSIACVLIENNVDVPLSCEMGLCGACLTPVVEGEVDHRDTVQSDEEKTAAQQQIALCCSRSRSARLVIDL